MIHEKSADTKIIESVLSEAVVGQLITYEELSKAIGRDVRQHAIGSLMSARRALLKSNGIVFGVEANVGYRRLDDEAIVESTESDRRRLQRGAKRSIAKLSVVNFDQLNDAKKKEHIAASAQMGVIAMFSGKAAQKKIAAKASEKSATLAIGETLKMFS